MKTGTLLKDGLVIVGKVELAMSLPQRIRGLLGRSDCPKGEAMLLSPCNSVHTFFMKFSLDLFFLDKDMCVVRIVRDVVPGKMVGGGIKARSVLESGCGWIGDSLSVGDRIQLITQ